jgi:hypothetical protein
LASGPKQESLTGDLIEQYRRRHSRIWYWRQVIAAIALGAVDDTRRHTALVIRSIAVCVLSMLLCGKLTVLLNGWLGVSVWNWSVEHGFDTFRVAWFGRPRSSVPSISVTIEMLSLCANAGIAGWIVARLHRGHAAATLMGCALLNEAFWLRPLLLLGPEAFWGAIAFNPVFFITQLGWHFVGVPFSILLGGLWAAPPNRDVPRPRSVA